MYLFCLPAQAVTINVLDKNSGETVTDAVVSFNGESVAVDALGNAHFERNVKQGTVTVQYNGGNIKRLQTLHDVPVKGDSLKVYLDDAAGVDKVAEFSLSVPFGELPNDVAQTSLLPQYSYEFAGINRGTFGKIRLYQDQLQNDGKVSFVVVGYNDKLLPYKYGYLLDQEPTKLELNSVALLKGENASPVANTAELLQWQKLADPINQQGSDTPCNFSEPPYNECAVFPPNRGIFSWINIHRKGVLYHAPGAFSPPRVKGANPVMALPDGVIELAGHDDPLGFYPFNYARHSFTRFDQMPKATVDVKMPNVIVGSKEQVGREAISVAKADDGYRVGWQLNAGNGDLSDVNAVDYGELELAWADDKSGQSIVWRHRFAARAGDGTVTINGAQLPDGLNLPEAAEGFANVQLWFYGSEGVNGYEEAAALWQTNGDVMMNGQQAFQVTRWR